MNYWYEKSLILNLLDGFWSVSPELILVYFYYLLFLLIFVYVALSSLFLIFSLAIVLEKKKQTIFH